MKRFLSGLFILFLLAVPGAVTLKAQEVTTQGKEFYLTFFRNAGSWTQLTGDTVRLFITATKNTTGTITNPRSTFSQSFSVTANTVTIVTLPNAECVFQDTTIRNRIIKVVANDTISLYSLNQKAFTTDASIILPTPALGSQYLVQSFSPGSIGMASQGLVFATENNTTIRITPKVALRNGRQAGVPFTITLNSAQGYYFESTNDLSGTRIESIDSCKRIGVYGGNECVNVPNSCGACDHIYEQHFPVETWGKTFIFTTSRSRSYDYLRITAVDSNTTVTINGASQTLHATNSIVQACSVNTKITSDKPVGVMGYEVGTACSNLGDPDIFWVAPIEQTLTRVVFCATPFSGIDKNYVNIVVRTIDTSRVYFNSVRLKGDSFTVISPDPTYAVAKLVATPGSNLIVCDSGFSAFSYGLGSANSYAYSTGSSARGVRIGVTVNGGSTANRDTAYICGTKTANFQLSLNKPVNSVLWTLYTGTNDTSTSLTPSFTYPDTGLYQVRVLAYRGGDCSALVDTIYLFLKIQPPGEVNGGPDTMVCINGSVTLNASAKFGKPTGWIYQWNFALSAGPSKVFSTQKDSTVRIILTDGCGFKDTDYVFVEVKDSLKLSLSRKSDTTLCLGDSITVTASGNGGNGNYTFTWSNGLGTGSSKKIKADSSRSYKVYLHDNCNSPYDSAMFRIYVRPPLDITARDTNICYGNSVTITPLPAGGDSSYTLSWNQGLGTGASKTLNPSNTTNYRVILTDGCTVKSDTANFTVTVKPALNLSFAIDTAYHFRNDTIWDCPDLSSAFLNTIRSGGDSTRWSVRWDNGLGTGFSKTVSPSATTRYRAILSDSCSLSEDTAYVTVLKFSPISLSEVNDTVLCYGDTANYTFSVSGGAGIYYKRLVISDSVGSAVHGTYYVNSSQSLSLQLAPLSNKSYKAVVSDSCTNSDTVYFNIAVRAALDINLRSDTSICKGNSVFLQTQLSGGNSSNYTITWNQGLGTGTSKTVSPDTSTIYRVILSDACSNRNDTDEVKVSVRPALELTLPPDTTICQGVSFSITTFSAGGDSTYIRTWNHGLGTGFTKTVSPDTTITYRVILSDECTVKNDTDYMTVFVRPPLFVNLPADTTICKGNGLTLSPLSYGGGDSSYSLTWNHGLGSGDTKSISPDTSTTYRLIISDGCSPANDTDYMRVFVRPALDIQLAADTTICIGNSIQISPNANGGDSSYTLSWNNGLGSGTSKTVSPDTSTTYTVILSDACTVKNDTDQMRVFVRQPLSSTQSNDTVVCYGSAVSMSIQPFGGDSSYIVSWSHGLGTGLNKTVNVSDTTTYTAILSDGCTVRNDTSYITVYTLPPLQLSFSPDSAICVGKSFTIEAIGSGGSASTRFVTWNNGLDTGSTHTVSPDTTTTYSVILSDGCTLPSDTQEMTLQVYPPLQLRISNDTALCLGEGSVLRAFKYGGRPNSGIITWSHGLSGEDSIAVNPPVTTTYMAVLSDNCSVRNDTEYVTLYVKEPLDVSITTPDTTICAGTTVTLKSRGFGGQASTYQFEWSPGNQTTGAITVSPTVNSTYRVILRDLCTAIEDTAYINVFIRDPLRVRQSDTTICPGRSIQATPKLSGGDSSYFLVWDGGADSSFSRLLSPDTTTSYRLDLFDGCTPQKDSSSFTIYVRPKLDINLRSDTLICKGNSVLLQPELFGGDSTYTVSWNNSLGSGISKTVAPDSSTTYLAVLSDGCSTKDDSVSVRIFVRDALELGLRSDTTICIGNSVSLDALVKGGDSSYNLRWNNGLADGFNHSVSPITSTTYRAVLSDGCTVKEDTAELTVFVRLPLTLSFPPEDTICIGNSTTLRTLLFGGDSSYTVSWSHSLPDADTAVVNPIVTTSYTVVLSDGCTVKNDTNFVSVFVRDSLHVQAVTDTTICFGQGTVISAIPEGGRAQTWKFDWDNGLGEGSSKNVAPTDTTIYSVILSDACTVKPDTATVIVRVRPSPIVYAGRDTLICEGKSVTLSAVGKHGKPEDYVYTWNNGLGTGASHLVTPLTTTTYIVRLEDNCSPNVSDTVIVNVENRPQLEFYVSDSFICLGERVRFENLSSGPVSYTYTWRFGNGVDSTVLKPQYTYPTDGIYDITLIAKSALGCVDSLVKTAYMQVNPNPVADFSTNPGKGNYENATVKFIQKSTLADNYAWDFGDGSTFDFTSDPIHKYEDTGWYKVTLVVSTDEGCFDTISKPFRVDEVYHFYIPAAFSPNADGDNEVFKYDGRGYVKVHIQIYNRWGELVFESNKRNEFWNGAMNNNGELLPEGVYVYNITVLDYRNQFHTYAGNVTMLR